MSQQNVFLYCMFWRRAKIISINTCLKILWKKKKIKHNCILKCKASSFSFWNVHYTQTRPLCYMGCSCCTIFPPSLWGMMLSLWNSALVYVSTLTASTSCSSTFASAIPVSRSWHSAYETSLFCEGSRAGLPMS